MSTPPATKMCPEAVKSRDLTCDKFLSEKNRCEYFSFLFFFWSMLFEVARSRGATKDHKKVSFLWNHNALNGLREKQT